MCIDIAEFWSGIAKDKFCQFMTGLSVPDTSYFRFWTIMLVNINGFSRNLVHALMLWRLGLGLQMGKFRQFLTVIWP